jgi:DHA3 family macrolide efflux protein-like MFS transporter
MSMLASSSRPSAFAVLRKPAFTLLWVAQLISVAGSALTALAASILVYRLTGSALSVGLMLMATALPSLLIGLVAGVFVDRYDRKRIMIAADLIRAGLIACIPLLVTSSIVWLYVIVIISSAVGQFFAPAQASLLPETASDDELAAANALIAISSFGSTAIGFAAAGLIAARFPIEWAFYLDALSFLVSAVCIVPIRVAPLAVDDRTTVATVVRNLRAGARFLIDTPSLRSMFLIYLPIFVCFGFMNTLVLPFALRALHTTEFEYGLLPGVESIGLVIGSLLMARLADRLHEGQWIALSFLGMGLAEIWFAQAPAVPLAIALFTANGFLNAPSIIGRQLVIQRRTPRELRGRVNSAFFVTRDVAFAVGMASAGLADVFDVRVLFLLAGVVVLGCGLLTLALPGLGQPNAEWRRALAMLRAAPSAPGLGLGRAARLADIDQLAMHLLALAGLSRKAREELAAQTRIYDAPAGTAIVRQGDQSDAAYFLLDGRTVASQAVDGAERVLEVHNAGDFFGEIAALTSVPRTASVIAERPTRVLEAPAAALRKLMHEPQINRVFLSKLTERMLRMRMVALPGFGGLDQATLRDLRTPVSQSLPEAQPMPTAV